MSRLFQRHPLKRSHDQSCDRIMGHTKLSLFCIRYALYKMGEQVANLTSDDLLNGLYNIKQCSHSHAISVNIFFRHPKSSTGSIRLHQ